jgi:hypothetical protein
MFPIAGRLSLRGRRTLEEGGPDVVVRCNNVVLTWLIRDGAIDPLDEEEDGNEEEESGGVMVRCLGEDKEQDGDEGCEESESFPCADFWSAGHRWIECTRRSGCQEATTKVTTATTATTEEKWGLKPRQNHLKS